MTAPDRSSPGVHRPPFRFGVMYECRRLPGNATPMAGLPPGVDPAATAANLERLAHDVLPRVREPLPDPDHHDPPTANLVEHP